MQCALCTFRAFVRSPIGRLRRRRSSMSMPSHSHRTAAISHLAMTRVRCCCTRSLIIPQARRPASPSEKQWYMYVDTQRQTAPHREAQEKNARSFVCVWCLSRHTLPVRGISLGPTRSALVLRGGASVPKRRLGNTIGLTGCADVRAVAVFASTTGPAKPSGRLLSELACAPTRWRKWDCSGARRAAP